MEQTSRRIGPYEIRDEIGHSRFYTTYVAYEPEQERFVALKVASRRIAADPDLAALFLEVGERSARLKHRNIVPVRAAGTHEGLPYLAADYVDGVSLRRWLDQANGQVSPVTASMIAQQIAAALDYAHRRGVLHRDLHADNVFVTDDQRVLVADFLLAELKAAAGGREPVDYVHTADLPFLAPEQLRVNVPVRETADVYSLGVLTYQMLTGGLPFAGDDPAALRRAVVHAMPTPPEAVSPDVPPGMAYVLKCVLAKEPEMRYATASDFAVALQEGQMWMPGSSAAAEALATADRTVGGDAGWAARHRVPLFLLLALAAVVVAMLALLRTSPDLNARVAALVGRIPTVTSVPADDGREVVAVGSTIEPEEGSAAEDASTSQATPTGSGDDDAPAADAANDTVIGTVGDDQNDTDGVSPGSTATSADATGTAITGTAITGINDSSGNVGDAELAAIGAADARDSGDDAESDESVSDQSGGDKTAADGAGDDDVGGTDIGGTDTDGNERTSVAVAVVPVQLTNSPTPADEPGAGTSAPTATDADAPSATSQPTDTATAPPTETSTPRPTATATTRPTATNTPRPTATNTPRRTATNTPRPTSTNTPRPTSTNTVQPTSTNTPRPTSTNTAQPTSTNTAQPTATNTAQPTATNTPVPTPTPRPTLTSTRTSTPRPTATAGATPTEAPAAVAQVILPTPTFTRQPTSTPRPTATSTPAPTSTPLPTFTATIPPPPTSTNTPAPTATATAIPVSASTLQLISPGNGTAGGGEQTFEWSTTITPQENQAFELVFWPVGGDPMAQGFGLAAPTTNNRLNVDLSDLDRVLPPGLLEPGEYYWGLLLVIRDPYERVQFLGQQFEFQYVRNSGGSSSVSAPPSGE